MGKEWGSEGRERSREGKGRGEKVKPPRKKNSGCRSCPDLYYDKIEVNLWPTVMRFERFPSVAVF